MINIFLCYYVIPTVSKKIFFLYIVIRQFVLGLDDKYCGDEYIATCPGLPHIKYLVIGQYTRS